VRPFKAAIFDLDGTLLDSLSVWDKVDRDFLKAHGLPFTPDYTKAVGKMSFQEAAEYTVRRYGLKCTPDIILREWDTMVEKEYACNIPLKPYAKKYLDSLRARGVKLGVATALAENLYAPALKNNGVYGYFEAFASVHETKRGKGFPDVYLLAAKRMKQAPHGCAVFEDLLTGIRGAKAAGMMTVGVADRHSAADEEEIRRLADSFISFG
jgi:HAD superfamily hydrolase (TIGR01509 family)